MRKFHSLFESTQGHRAYFNAAAAEPLQEASIAKMNRKAKAAGDVGSKNPDSKNYSPKEISMIKKAAAEEADDAGFGYGGARGAASIEVKDGNVYLTIDHGDEKPQHDKTESYVKTDGEPFFTGWSLPFIVTIGKGGKMQYQLHPHGWRGKWGSVDYFADKILDGAEAAAKNGGMEGLKKMIDNVLDYDDIDEFWDERREHGYGWSSYKDDYPVYGGSDVGMKMFRAGKVYQG